jgi:hypothetical protein
MMMAVMQGLFWWGMLGEAAENISELDDESGG